jgi:hypothetical protein
MPADTTTQSETIIACTPDVIPAERRERWMEVGMQVYGAVEEVHELPDGYACRLPSDAATLLKAAEYVSLDRLCCAFARWSLVIEPNGGPLWLHITGAEGVKELTRSTFETTPMLSERVARAAGFSVASRVAWAHPSDLAVSTASYDAR